VWVLVGLQSKPPWNSSDKDSFRGGRRWSRRAAFGFYAVVSLVVWIAIAVLFSILTPEQRNDVATDKDTKELRVAPATGPDAEPGTRKAE